MTILTLLFGLLFGWILQYASLNKFNTISGMATLENLAVAKAIALAVGLGAILLSIVVASGGADFHVKPLILGGIVIGGLLFGMGMAILGYCPGTLAISLGEGSLDAFWGIVGALLGGLVYTLVLPSIKSILGPDLGALSLQSLVSNQVLYFILLFVLAGAFIAVAFWMDKLEGPSNKKWLYSGVALAILNVIVFSKIGSNRPIGASTTFPYVSDYLAGLTQNDYYLKIEKPGNWELIFLAGAFLAGLSGSLLKKDFKLKTVHENWEKYKGSSAVKRAVWALIGGFILLFGARMAGGCTSGHILSGGMQMAFSSLLFAVLVFAGLLITGKFFYRK